MWLFPHRDDTYIRRLTAFEPEPAESLLGFLTTTPRKLWNGLKKERREERRWRVVFTSKKKGKN